VEDSPSVRWRSFLLGACTVVALDSGCSRPHTASAESSKASPSSSVATAPAPSAKKTIEPVAPVALVAAAKAVNPAQSAEAAPAAKPTETAAEGQDLKDAALRLFRVAACGTAGELPERFSREQIDRHCKRLESIYERYRKRWLTVAMPFIAELRPKDLPRRVVYPFGGGDLVSALAVYPDAEEYTTLSLEPPGDVRKIDTVLPIRLAGALSVNGKNLGKLLGISYSSTLNLGRGERAALPGEIVLLLAAMVVHGYEPTSLRYFEFRPDGSLHYLTAEEVTAQGNLANPAPEGANAAFASVEIGFHKPGVAGSDKVVRHIAQDLSNPELAKSPGLRAYLEGKGPVAIMTKAASHLLWADDFSTIRDYVLGHAAWMISDSTGVPPRYATPAGYVQDTYGTFEGPANFGPIEPIDGKAFKLLFKTNPRQALPFKFGYGDVNHRHHMIVMHKGAAAAPRG
jgi:hypothetical protein